MIQKLGKKFTDIFQRFMPDAFVFALLLTLITAGLAMTWTEASTMKVIRSWYDGFWLLLEFGMQMVLLVVTGYSIALSPLVNRGIDTLAGKIRSPRQVYFLVVLLGSLFCLVSWGWMVVTAVLGRELALRIKGIHYPYLIACIYFSNLIWVCGLSSSIPLLLNTPGNFILEAGILSSTLPTADTLGSSLNLVMMGIILVTGPLLMHYLAPRSADVPTLKTMLGPESGQNTTPIREEARLLKLPYKAFSDLLNNSMIIQYVIALSGTVYLIHHFMTRGLDLNLNVMIFTFLILGLYLHGTPMRYVIAMKRASGNISGIVFQFPFYAGIMGIMIYTGLGEKLALWMASVASVDSVPFFAFLSGALVNFAIPSAGGEFAVIGPSILQAVQEIGAGLPEQQLNALISRAAMSVAYGESLTNLLQPFFLLVIIPVLGSGTKIQARDIMGYLVIPFLFFLLLQLALVSFWPL
ncbi:short-chain fatty acid transporter [Muriicola jejuensis]|uniref:TIGR00366 family protein n=1 Tax=Muriicola jejuensis TaxID=504488 RepID=A0A6P0U7S8_9FLAO|nr:TIGR00366 family protein [Muriicola jejuensis]NER09134.1 TIGR00366 family protein [Muriicola jejuensis]